MEFTNYFHVTDPYHRIKINEEVMSQVPLVHAMYQDIINTIGCFPLHLITRQYGRIEMMKNGSICLTRPGLYLPPSTIIIGMMDVYISAYDHGRQLGILDMDIMYKAEMAYTLIHEISHSMQNTFITDPNLMAAMEWANDKNVWDNLYPILAPMLKKKYKVKLFEETVDPTCGRVFAYKYTTSSSFECLMRFFVFNAFPNDNGAMKDLLSRFEYADNLKVYLQINAYKDVFVLKQKGVMLTDNVESLRDTIDYPFETVDYRFSVSTGRNDRDITIDVGLRTAEREPFFRPEAPNWQSIQ